MDVFYEESAVFGNALKAEKKYKIVNIISCIFLVLWIICLFLAINFLPGFFVSGEGRDQTIAFCIFFLWNTASFFLIWFLLAKWKKTLNVSYDYCFVSGELRISKVFNINKRKLITRFDCAEILQMGDVDNSSYARLKLDPTTKSVFCTSNDAPADDKFFMYILIQDNGKKLYVLECRETLLVHILNFAPRSVLESDYVKQEKKKAVR